MQMLNIRLTVSPEWKSGEIKAIKKGRGAKRIVANQSLFHRNLKTGTQPCGPWNSSSCEPILTSLITGLVLCGK